MADSRREVLLKAIKTKLEAIIGDTSYNYGAELKNVQRKIHRWDGEDRVVNKLSDVPCILITVQQEVGAMDTVEMWNQTLDVDLEFILRGDTADDADVNAALADMQRALFAGSFDGFGSNVTNVRISNRLVDPQTGMPVDGIHLGLSMDYAQQFGDPTAGY